MTIKLGIPSKGRLMQDTLDWFGARGISIERTGTDREYAGRVQGIDGVELVLLSAGEIPYELAAGRIALGVTGTDVVREKIAGWDQKMTELTPMGFGQADLVLAVPKTWTDVSDLTDLDAVAEAFWKTHGLRLRIATKYHRLVRAYLRDAGVAGYQLVDSQGATEGTVANGTAEAIADITSTGATLEANHLKIIGEVIHASQATLFRSDTAALDRADQTLLKAFLDRLKID
ncbi:MAG: ATP phosphoribosyltransferase [Paracoccaceae bacterium]|nr:ATP phosphoribosyltransferase [Paracoccaceae bacterium]